MKLGCQTAPTTEQHIKYLARYGVEAIAAEVARLQAVFLGALDRSRYRPVFGGAGTQSSIVSLVGPQDAKTLCRALMQENVICTERGGYLRFAPHFHNTDEEVERVAGMLNLRTVQ